MDILAPLAGLIAPFVLWPIEYFFPVPFVFEEITKGALVLLIDKSRDLHSKFMLALVIGFAFSLSESILYIINLVTVGGVNGFFTRLILTSILHISTTQFMMLTSLKSKYYIIFGVVISILIHYLYNLYISSVYLI